MEFRTVNPSRLKRHSEGEDQLAKIPRNIGQLALWCVPESVLSSGRAEVSGQAQPGDQQKGKPRGLLAKSNAPSGSGQREQLSGAGGSRNR